MLDIRVPGMSYLVLPWALLSLTIGTASAKAIAAMKMFTNRHQRQVVYWVSTPPMIRPIAAPTPEIAPNTPKALARSFTSVEGDRDQRQGGRGEQRAERALQAARREQHALVLGEAAERGGPGEADQADQEDPLAPDVVGDPAAEQQQAAKASVYAVRIHCRLASVMCRSCWAEGIAMFTMVASRTP